MYTCWFSWKKRFITYVIRSCVLFLKTYMYFTYGFFLYNVLYCMQFKIWYYWFHMLPLYLWSFWICLVKKNLLHFLIKWQEGHFFPHFSMPLLSLWAFFLFMIGGIFFNIFCLLNATMVGFGKTSRSYWFLVVLPFQYFWWISCSFGSCGSKVTTFTSLLGCLSFSTFFRDKLYITAGCLKRVNIEILIYLHIFELSSLSVLTLKLWLKPNMVRF